MKLLRHTNIKRAYQDLVAGDHCCYDFEMLEKTARSIGCSGSVQHLK
jgi:hypothetical protein